MNNVSITQVSLLNLDVEEWENLLIYSNEATFFCSTDFLKLFSKTSFVLVRKNGLLIGGIAFRLDSRLPLIGSYFKTARIDSSVIVIDSIGVAERLLVKERVVEYLISSLKNESVIYLFISPLIRSNDADLFSKYQFNNEIASTFVLSLKREVSEIYKGFSKGKKSAIVKASKGNLIFSINTGPLAVDLIDDYMKLQNKLFDQKKDFYSRLYYKTSGFFNDLLTSRFYKTYLAIVYYNNQPASAAILISYRNVIYYYQGASDYNLAKEIPASDFLHFEIIKFAKNNGFFEYDLGGIPNYNGPELSTYGVYKFKKSFGGERMSYDAGSLIIHPVKFKFISLLLKYQNSLIIKWLYKTLK
ncbi:MAG: lipid II:glycine glycyltransferase FemX [Bacteroidales bacterium]